MMTMLRRLFWLALLGGAGYAGWTVWQRKDAAVPAAAPEWPPLGDTGAKPPASSPTASSPTAGSAAMPADDRQPGDDAESATSAVRWVAPLDDGSCPDGFSIKANDKSGIYHVPGGRFYDRTAPERCYAHTEECEADGYRAAKS